MAGEFPDRAYVRRVLHNIIYSPVTTPADR
jgi:hypothetical protein